MLFSVHNIQLFWLQMEKVEMEIYKKVDTDR